MKPNQSRCINVATRYYINAGINKGAHNDQHECSAQGGPYDGFYTRGHWYLDAAFVAWNGCSIIKYSGLQIRMKVDHQLFGQTIS